MPAANKADAYGLTVDLKIFEMKVLTLGKAMGNLKANPNNTQAKDAVNSAINDTALAAWAVVVDLSEMISENPTFKLASVGLGITGLVNDINSIATDVQSVQSYMDRGEAIPPTLQLHLGGLLLKVMPETALVAGKLGLITALGPEATLVVGGAIFFGEGLTTVADFIAPMAQSDKDKLRLQVRNANVAAQSFGAGPKNFVQDIIIQSGRSFDLGGNRSASWFSPTQQTPSGEYEYQIWDKSTGQVLYRIVDRTGHDRTGPVSGPMVFNTAAGQITVYPDGTVTQTVGGVTTNVPLPAAGRETVLEVGPNGIVINNKPVALEKGLGEGTLRPTSEERARLIQIASGAGSVFGSSLGNFLAGDSAVRGVVYSSVIGEIGERLAATIAAGSVTETVMPLATQQGLTSFGSDVAVRAGQAAIGSVSTWLSMELGEALGLKGFGAELFTTAGTTVTSRVISNLLDNTLGSAKIFNGMTVQGIVKGGPPTSSGSAMAGAIGAFLGAKLGALVVSPQTQAGLALSSIGSAVGSYAAMQTALQGGLYQLTMLGNFVVPGVGAFAGFVLGALIGNLFGKKKPKIPSASAETVLQIPYARYELGAITVTNGGNRDLVTSMATTARDTLNGLIAMVAYTNTTAYVSNLNGVGTTQAYGHTANQIYVKINGVQTNFASADQAVEFGTLAAIRNTKIVGGDIFAKRVIARSPAADLTSLTGDLQIASDYRFYANNRDLVNGFITGAYATLTEAEQSYYAANKALIDKTQTQGAAALTAGELSAYTANKATIDKIVGALENQALANPWIITLQRVSELGLDKWTPSDFYGGLQGFLSSFDLAGHWVAFENVRVASSGAGAVVSLRGGGALQPFIASAKAHVGFGSSAASGGWTSQDLYPRFLADVNGDGRQDMVGVGNSQVIVELGQTNGTFSGGLVAGANLTVAAGWTSQNISPRMAGDINGDGRADLVGFGADGTYVMLGQANGGFGAAFKANAGYGSTGGAGGWSSQDAYPRFLADVNGDGRTDVVGVGGSVVLVSLGQADGSLANGVVASTQFTAAAGWGGQDRNPRTAADVNGDGRADLVGFADDGVYVSLAQNNGTFGAAYKAITAYGYAAGGWTSFNANPRYVQDFDGDGRADIIGYGNGALYVSLAQADGMFAPNLVFSTPYVSQAGWGPQSSQPRMVGDVDGDGVLDLVAIAADGVYVQRGSNSAAGLFSSLPSAAQDGRSVSIDNLSAIGYAVAAPGAASSGNDLIDRHLSSVAVTLDDNHTETQTTYQYYWNGWDYDEVAVETQVTVDGGDDIFIGGAGNDVLYGRSGRDWLDGGAGNDQLDGGDGNDVLIGGAGDDVVSGFAGDDYLAVGDGADYAFGGAGNDTLADGPGFDVLQGEDGDDTFLISVDASFNWFWGGTSTAYGPTYGSDTISADRMTVGVRFDIDYRPADWTSNNPDTTAAKADSRQALVVNAATGAVLATDGLLGIQNATGSHFSDQVYGTVGDNVLKGLGGDDQLWGRDGDDTVEGGAGADVLHGDAGYDWLSYAGSATGISVDLSTGEAFGGDAEGDVFDGFEAVRGSKLADQLKGSNGGDNWLDGGAGDDWLVATTGADTFLGGEGKDFVDYSAAIAGVTLSLGGYTPTGTTSGYGSGGLAAGQTYIGVEGVVGTAFGDNLSATDGDQTFVGAGGADSLAGGAGADTYVLSRGDGSDTVTEDNQGWNTFRFGESIKFSDLWIGASGGSSGWLDVGVRGTSDVLRMVSNFGAYPIAGNNKLKSIDTNGAGQLDVGAMSFAMAGDDNANTLYGGANRADMIFGYNGNDVLFGVQSGSSDSTGDVFVGGLGNDVLYGSGGDDQFGYDRGDGLDSINDAGGDDTIVFGPTVAAQDVIYQVVGNDLYIGAKDLANTALTASQVADRIRIVGGGTKTVVRDGYTQQPMYEILNTAEYVIAGGTSIDLRKLDIAWTVQYVDNYDNYSPIALDLDGDGLNLSAVDSSNVVVKTAQGGLSKIGWVGPTDGFLAVDRDGDGAINTLSEFSFVQDKPGATSDLEGLRTWDSNGDGRLNKADQDFSRILLFVDANQNGRSTAKELRTLEQAGIVAINLGGTATGYTRQMTTESFVQNTLSFVWADGREGQGYDVALARRVLGSEGLYAGEYQAEWGARDEDGTLGQLLNDPKTAAKAARIKAKKGLLDRLGASYAETKAVAQVDFSDHDRVDAAIAKRWKKMDASQQAAWLSGQASGQEGYQNLDRVRSISAQQSLWAAQGRSAKAGRDLVTHGLDQASARIASQAPQTPTTSSAAAGAGEGSGVTFGAASSLGGVVSSEPLDAATPPGAAMGQDQAWWRGEAGGDLVGASSLGALLAVMDQTASAATPGLAPAGDDPSLLSQQALLRQAMAGFGGQKGGSAAIWNRDAAQASAVLAPANPNTLPTTNTLAMAS